VTLWLLGFCGVGKPKIHYTSSVKSHASIGMVAALIAAWLDWQEIIAADVVIGGEIILALTTEKEQAMREQMRARLEILKKEFQTGQAELQKVEQQRMNLRETMLRISGAIQILEELLAEGQTSGENGTGPGETQPATGQANERS
jgi:hypothetical protein